MKKKHTLRIFAIFMSALMIFSGSALAAPPPAEALFWGGDEVRLSEHEARLLLTPVRFELFKRDGPAFIRNEQQTAMHFVGILLEREAGVRMIREVF